MKRNVLLFGTVAILFASAGMFIGDRHSTPGPAEASAVENLLSQSMADASGNRQSLAQWKDKTLIVNFWATWCAPCVEEMPDLVELQGEIGADGMQVIGIGIDSPSNIAEFAAKHKISYPLYVGGVSGTELSRQLGNQSGGLPFTVVIDRDGQVRKTYLGRLKMEELRNDLRNL